MRCRLTHRSELILSRFSIHTHKSQSHWRHTCFPYSALFSFASEHHRIHRFILLLGGSQKQWINLEEDLLQYCAENSTNKLLEEMFRFFANWIFYHERSSVLCWGSETFWNRPHWWRSVGQGVTSSLQRERQSRNFENIYQRKTSFSAR